MHSWLKFTFTSNEQTTSNQTKTMIMNKKTGITISLFINYFVFAILLNSVGIVMLKAQNVYGVDELEVSILEAFKDLPIAIVSFLVASFLPRIGYKRAMLAAMLFVTTACIYMYFGNSFTASKVLFATVGVSFALIKVSVYTVIGLVTDGVKEHNSLMSRIEGVFMFGVALAYFLFPAFNNDASPDSWLNVYWLLAGLSILSFLFLFFTKFEGDSETTRESITEALIGIFRLAIVGGIIYFIADFFGDLIGDLTGISYVGLVLSIAIILSAFYLSTKTSTGTKILGDDLKNEIVLLEFLLVKILVIVFVISAFLFVMVEQGIMTWLPTFNSKVLNLPENIGIMMSSILAISLGIGRIAAGYLSQRFSWFWILIICIIISMAMVVLLLPQAINAEVGTIEHLSDIPLIGFAFPIIGLFLAPIYPLINSAVLSALPKRLHSPMTGLIVIFSALGGTLGSRAIGYLFKTVGGDTAFYYTLIPMGLLFIALFFLKRLTDQELIKLEKRTSGN